MPDESEHSSEATERVQKKAWEPRPQTWVKGQSGNPDGRPKGIRNKLSTAYMNTLMTVWEEANAKGKQTGLDALRRLADERPDKFAAEIGKLVPRSFELDGETAEGFAGIWAVLAKASASKDE